MEFIGPGTQVSVVKIEGLGWEERDGWMGTIRYYED